MKNKYLLGAFDINLNYISPNIAIKNNLYKCIDCNENIILKKGNIRSSHFSHKNNSLCSFYEHSNESSFHKDSKYKLCDLYKLKKNIIIKLKCSNNKCNNNNNDLLFEIKYDIYDNVNMEYISYDNNKNKYICDIAITNNNNIKYIFEIKYTHSTTTNIRPEPWFEFTTDEIFNKYNNLNDNIIYLQCSRYISNRLCKICKISKELWINNIPKNINNNECLYCKTNKYTKIFHYYYKQICTDCIVNNYDIIKKEYNNHKYYLLDEK